MNKSKFLKRSLAALLAILLVAAMIPMSAFAAEPDIIKVNGVEVTRSGDAYSVSITAPNGTASVIENALKSVTFELRSKNGITVGILDKDDKQKDVDLAGWPDEPGTKQTINLLDYAVKPEGTYWGDYTGIKLQITTSAGVSTIYPLTVNVSERSASSDTTITAVESTRIVNANVDVAKHHIEIIKPVGCDNTMTMLGLGKENFKTASPNADVSFETETLSSGSIWGTGNQKITKVIVTAEDKSTQEYTISYKVETIFTEFNVPGMISYKEEEDGNRGIVKITVEVPYNAFDGKIIPTFTPSANVKEITSKAATHIAHASFTDGDGILYKDGKSTSGVAIWKGTADDPNTRTNKNGMDFLFDVETGKSSLENTTDTDHKGTVSVVFMPVKNREAKILGVHVGASTGAATFNQGMIEIANGTTTRNIIVGDLTDAQLLDSDNNNNDDDVKKVTLRDVKLTVSNNATVTVLEPRDGLVNTKIDDNNDSVAASSGNVDTTVKKNDGTNLQAPTAAIAPHDGIVVLENVNLRKYSSTPMRVLVRSEEGKNETEYRLTFKGGKSLGTKPEIKSVTLHGANAAHTRSSTKDNKGNIIIHVPYKANFPEIPGADTSQVARVYSAITVDATDGAIVESAVADTGAHAGAALTEETSMTGNCIVYPISSLPASITNAPEKAGYFIRLDAYYAGAISAHDADAESVTYVYIIVDPANDKATTTDIILTEETELVNAIGSKLVGRVNPNDRTIRFDVPFDFAKDENGNFDATTKVYLYSVVKSEDSALTNNTGWVRNEFVLSQLDVQDDGTEDKIIGPVLEQNITSIDSVSSYDRQTNGMEIKIYSEATDPVAAGSQETDTTKKFTSYKAYFVRANASSESKLNSVSASAPVTVTKDTSVDKLNRFIITIPKNYNSTTGINAAKEFELNFSDRSKNSTVENGQTVWAGKDVDTVKFKVADGKLYFKDNEANLTDGRVIHFTIRAEDRTSTGAYEFLIREGEASKDATISSIKVDDSVSFTKDGSSFIVKDLTENENYDVTKLPVVITTTDPGATVTVDGKDYIPEVTTVDLSEGKTATVVVTAADEVTTATYTLSMRQGEEPGTDPADSYTDLDKVPSGMRDTVKKAINLGLMSNTGKEGIFDPKANVSRKDFAVIIARADLMATDAEIEDSKMADAALAEMADDSIFDDLGGLNDIQKGAVAYCKEKGYINGNGKGGFEPNKGLSRQEATVILAQWRGLTIDKTDTENDNNVSDWSKADNWAKPYINAVLENKLMNGKDFGFDPKGSVNREQTAVMLVNVFDQKYPEFE